MDSYLIKELFQQDLQDSQDFPGFPDESLEISIASGDKKIFLLILLILSKVFIIIIESIPYS